MLLNPLSLPIYIYMHIIIILYNYTGLNYNLYNL